MVCYAEHAGRWVVQMDEAATEAIKKAIAILEQELAPYEDFRRRDDILRKSLDELKALLPPLSPADRT